MIPVPEGIPLDQQPVEMIDVVGGLYFRSLFLEKAGYAVPQHTHDHDHVTYIGAGAARLWMDGAYIADYKAGSAIEIKGGHEHMFQALEDGTRLTCIWDEKVGETL